MSSDEAGRGTSTRGELGTGAAQWDLAENWAEARGDFQQDRGPGSPAAYIDNWRLITTYCTYLV
jgi:hypothetical protein